MNRPDLEARMMRSEIVRRENADAITAFVRPLVSALKDLGRDHTAKELEQLLFIYDAHEEETRAWMRTHAEEIADFIIKFRLGGPTQ